MTVDRPNTLAGLVEKRAEIAGQIAHTRATLRQLIMTLTTLMRRSGFSIRATLNRVEHRAGASHPGLRFDVEGIRQKMPSAAHRALRGDPDAGDAGCAPGRAGAYDDEGAGPARHGRTRAQHG